MRNKVICSILVYNGETYHIGDSLDVESETEQQMLIRERCIEEIVVKKTEKPPDFGAKAQEGGKRK